MNKIRTKRKSILCAMLAGSMLVANVQSIFAVTPVAIIPPSVGTQTLNLLKSGILWGIENTASTFRSAAKGWKKFDKAVPMVAGALTTIFIAYCLKNPVKYFFKQGIKSIPEKASFRVGLFIPFVTLPFGPKLSYKHEIQTGWLKEMFQDQDEKEKIKPFDQTSPKLTLLDLADEKLHPKLEKYMQMIKRGIKIKPIYIHGSPGTGKSTEAEVFASEIEKRTGSEVVFLSTSGASFLSKYVGESAKRVREIVKTATDITGQDADMITKFFKIITGKKKVVIFIDELLSLTNGTKGENQHGWATVEALQVVISRTFPSANIFLIATGNSTDLPKAMLRRFNGVFFPKDNIERKLKVLDKNLKKESTLLGLANPCSITMENNCSKTEEQLTKKDFLEIIKKANLQHITDENILSSHMPDIAKEAVNNALEENAKKITKTHLEKAIIEVVKDEDEKFNPESLLYAENNNVKNLIRNRNQNKNTNQEQKRENLYNIINNDDLNDPLQMVKNICNSRMFSANACSSNEENNFARNNNARIKMHKQQIQLNKKRSKSFHHECVKLKEKQSSEEIVIEEKI